MLEMKTLNKVILGILSLMLLGHILLRFTTIPKTKRSSHEESALLSHREFSTPERKFEPWIYVTDDVLLEHKKSTHELSKNNDMNATNAISILRRYTAPKTTRITTPGILSAKCKALIVNDRVNGGISSGKDTQFRKWRIPDVTSDDDVAASTKDCENFKKLYKFISTEEEREFVRNEELDYPVAYSIVIYNHVHQFGKLLSAIYRTHNLYCVHLDAKANSSTLQAVEGIANCFPNVFMSTKRERVIYASYSRLLADINCMRDLLAVPKTMYDWKYLLNLCGQDFPLSTNYEIVQQLKELRGKNSIAGTRVLNGIAKGRTEFVHKIMNVTIETNETVEKDIPTDKRHVPPPYNMTVIKNLAYNAYTRDFLQWSLVDSKEGAALLEWSQVTHTPDEHFWGMLNVFPGAPGGSQYVSWWQVVRKILWAYSPTSVCNGYWQRNVCVFGGGDLPQIFNRTQMFVNKLDVTYDVTTMDCLRELLDERTFGKRSPWNRDKSPRVIPAPYLD